MTAFDFFDRAFPLVTEAPRPFPWQRRLFLQFLNDDIPTSCNLPTGVGKTSVMAIWLLALAWRVIEKGSPLSFPRRLVYIVNRRTVVDQATDEAERIRKRLSQETALSPEDATLQNQIRDALQQLSGDSKEDPLAISTLRGQFADNAAWRTNPARAAIIAGTVDMIGSRLLFSGYGIGFKTRPLHAAFLGQDSLIVHDEAHLEPSFQSLLTKIASEQRTAGDLRPMSVMELTATSRSSTDAFQLDDSDHLDEALQERLAARKGLTFHEVCSEKQVAEAIAQAALRHKDSGQAILVFLNRVDDVEKVVNALGKAGQHLETLTGTKRGLERDALAKHNGVFARFLRVEDRGKGVKVHEGTVYLICTSAGEVGVNFSGDHLICDLTTLESMAQRLGRVNRFGWGDASVGVICPAEFDENDLLREYRERTRQALKALPVRKDGTYDASPLALKPVLNCGSDSFRPKPPTPHVDRILFDAWSMTTIRDLPGRPPVERWLHGDVDEDPQTNVAWRTEVDLLSPESEDRDSIRAFEELAQELLEDYPLKPHELLHDRSDRVLRHLKALAARMPAARVWLVDTDNSVSVKTLRAVVDDQRGSIGRLTVLLPPSLGGLDSRGMLSNEPPAKGLDVADQWIDEKGRLRRKRVLEAETPPTGMRLVRQLRILPTFLEGDSEEDAEWQLWRWYVRPRSANDEGSWSATFEQDLEEHQSRARAIAARFCNALQVPSSLGSGVIEAGGHHDDGKNRRSWQIGIGNRSFPAKVLAKSDHSRPPLNDHYRHEFGSLVDLAADQPLEFRNLPQEIVDLATHLIGAHHGRARPDFPATDVYREDFDPERDETVATKCAAAVAGRFAHLQRKYGRWGLAWLESLVRAADYEASTLNEGGE